VSAVAARAVLDVRVSAHQDADKRMSTSMTRLAMILDERNLTYTAVATRAHLQPRTVRQLATGETPIDNVAVGTVRRIASALSVPVTALLEPEPPHPGDPTLSRAARLSAAIRELVWSVEPGAYPSPVDSAEADDLATVAADEFFEDMPAVDGRRA
jgi:transcriptional regulator with XRE-family HTH domain